MILRSICLIFCFLILPQSFGDDGFTRDQISARVKQLKAAYYKNPTLSNLVKVSEELKRIKDGSTWIGTHPKDPVSLEFKKFHLSMLEVIEANSLLSACTKHVGLLERKTRGIIEALAGVNKVTPCSTKDYNEAIDDLDVYSLLQLQNADKSKIPRTMVPMLGKMDKKTVRQMVYYQQPQAHSDYLGTTRVYADARMRKLISDEQTRVVEEKVDQIMKYSTDEVGEQTEDYIKKKFGFDLKDNENSKLAVARATELHQKLMEGNRENCFRNYLYFKNRFALSGSEPVKENELTSEADNLFGKAITYGGATTMPEYEDYRLADLGRKDLKQFDKRYSKHPTLNEDDVLKMLEPAFEAVDFGNKASDEVRNTTSRNDDSNAYIQANIRRRARWDFKNGRVPAAFQKMKSSEVGFIVYSKAFAANLDRMSTMTLEQKRQMVRDAVKENVESTKKYADWISRNQGTRNFWNQDKGVWDLSKATELMMYSSPSVIQNVISHNPQLMGSMCYPMKEAAKKRSEEVPDWVNWGGGAMMLVGGPVAPIAGTAFGVVTALASTADLMAKNEAMAEQSRYVGLGEYILTKNWDEVNADKKDLKAAISKNEDAIIDNWIMTVIGELGGYGLSKALTSPSKLKSIAQELGLSPEAEKKAMQEIKDLTKKAEKELGRKLTPEEMKSLYLAHIYKRGAEGKIKGTIAGTHNYTSGQNVVKGKKLMEGGFSRKETQILLDKGIAGDAKYTTPILHTSAEVKVAQEKFKTDTHFKENVESEYRELLDARRANQNNSKVRKEIDEKLDNIKNFAYSRTKEIDEEIKTASTLEARARAALSEKERIERETAEKLLKEKNQKEAAELLAQKNKAESDRLVQAFQNKNQSYADVKSNLNALNFQDKTKEMVENGVGIKSDELSVFVKDYKDYISKDIAWTDRNRASENLLGVLSKSPGAKSTDTQTFGTIVDMLDDKKLGMPKKISQVLNNEFDYSKIKITEAQFTTMKNAGIDIDLIKQKQLAGAVDYFDHLPKDKKAVFEKFKKEVDFDKLKPEQQQGLLIKMHTTHEYNNAGVDDVLFAKKRDLVEVQQDLQNLGVSKKTAEKQVRELASEKNRILGDVSPANYKSTPVDLSKEATPDQINNVKGLMQKWRYMQENNIKGDLIVTSGTKKEAYQYIESFKPLKDFGFPPLNKSGWNKFYSTMDMSALKGLRTGYQVNLEDGSWARVRLDWDKTNFGHYNIEMRVPGTNNKLETVNVMVKFNCDSGPCSEQEVKKMAERLQ